jgi:glycosyltransferase involved in cell wall biosynthesis
MSVPFFSVIIPVYNRASNISCVIDSVVMQTFTDFEIILVDDGSEDRSELIKVLEGYPTVRLVLRENGGGGAARNTGIKEATGKYIAFLDSDDYFKPEKLRECFGFITDGKFENLFMFTSFEVDRGVGKTWIKPDLKYDGKQRIDEYLTTDSGWSQTSTIVLDSELAKRVLFDESLPSSQDTDFTIRCFLQGGNFKFLDKPLSIMNDVYDPQRVSKQKNVQPLIIWIDSMLVEGISKKSNLAYKGWQCARIISEKSKTKAFTLFLKAFLSGCYKPKTAIRIFLQILLSENNYQKLMTLIIKLIGNK